jgi:hypothetical protein
MYAKIEKSKNRRMHSSFEKSKIFEKYKILEMNAKIEKCMQKSKNEKMQKSKNAKIKKIRKSIN